MVNNMNFTVLMSVYEKEQAIYLKECLDSILVNQSIRPTELVIVEDGPLTQELNSVLDEYQETYSNIIKRIKLQSNKGLGEALRIGLEECSFDIIARMDSDDVNDFYRFEKQLKFLHENRDVDLIGGSIGEFFEKVDNIKFIRQLPKSTKLIKKMAIRRNPINHVTVMFKKSAVMEVGSYQPLAYLEDYYLWIRMLHKGIKIVNMDDILVYVRTGEEMFKRRSNPIYIKSWWKLQQEMYSYKFINLVQVLINMIIIVTFIYIPPKIKYLVYKYILRTNDKILDNSK